MFVIYDLWCKMPATTHSLVLVESASLEHGTPATSAVADAAVSMLVGHASEIAKEMSTVGAVCDTALVPAHQLGHVLAVCHIGRWACSPSGCDAHSLYKPQVVTAVNNVLLTQRRVGLASGSETGEAATHRQKRHAAHNYSEGWAVFASKADFQAHAAQHGLPSCCAAPPITLTEKQTLQKLAAASTQLSRS
ncbi:hypothetical protein ACK3TF_002368 [Chlorella vulgaris]